MTRARGLSLIEVLAATAILAAVAAAVVPMLRPVRLHTDPMPTLLDLAAFADSYVLNPDSLPASGTATRLSFETQRGNRIDIEVELLELDNEPFLTAWVKFRAREAIVIRHMVLPDEEPAERTP